MRDRKASVFRADASADIGGGHVMRCLTLANALSRAGWRCGFAGSPETAVVVPAIERSGHEFLVIDGTPADEPAALARRWGDGVDLLIVDHYGLESAFESACRPWARRIIVIDDLADRPHDCDILLDQTLGRTARDYEGLVPGNCKLLLGPDYALLRPEFAESRPAALGRRKKAQTVRTILVSMGATDPHNVAAVALEGIRQSGLDVEVDVVAGAASPHLESLGAIAARMGSRVTVHEAVDDMAGLMARADVAISAAGGSSWERCCLGLPSLVVITAENQEKIAAELERVGAIGSLGRKSNVTPDGVAGGLQKLERRDGHRVSRMSVQSSKICDGRGTERTQIALVQSQPARDAGPVSVRMADRNDRDRILSWQKDPRTRRFARSPKAPTAREHAKWFDRSLADLNRLLMIIEHAGTPAGVLRLDRLEQPHTYEVSIFIAPDRFGLGVATAALSLARSLIPSATLHATVLPGNTNSHHLFRGAGYRLVQNTLYVNTPEGSGLTV